MLLMLRPAAGAFKKQAHGHGETKRSLLCVGCDFSGWHSFAKIIKTVATRCHILKVKCTKFDFGWGFATDHARGAYSAPQTPSWM